MVNSIDRPASEAVVELLLQVDGSEFEDIVNSEMRSTADKPRVTPEVAAALRDPRVLRRWYTALSMMHKSVEGQFSAKTADNTAMIKRLQATNAPRAKILKEQSSFETWRASALRVKNGLEIRLIEAKALLEQHSDPYVRDRAAHERNAALAQVAVLEDAIRRHMNACLKDGRSSNIDETLWAYLPVARLVGGGAFRRCIWGPTTESSTVRDSALASMAVALPLAPATPRHVPLRPSTLLGAGDN
jgi:hypothetical protein